LVETKEVSNVLTESLMKKPGYYSRNNDHAITGATNFRQSKEVFFFRLETAQVGSAAHSAAFSIFTGFSLP